MNKSFSLWQNHFKSIFQKMEFLNLWFYRRGTKRKFWEPFEVWSWFFMFWGRHGYFGMMFQVNELMKGKRKGDSREENIVEFKCLSDCPDLTIGPNNDSAECLEQLATQGWSSKTKNHQMRKWQGWRNVVYFSLSHICDRRLKTLQSLFSQPEIYRFGHLVKTSDIHH